MHQSLCIEMELQLKERIFHKNNEKRSYSIATKKGHYSIATKKGHIEMIHDRMLYG